MTLITDPITSPDLLTVTHFVQERCTLVLVRKFAPLFLSHVLSLSVTVNGDEKLSLYVEVSSQNILEKNSPHFSFGFWQKNGEVNFFTQKDSTVLEQSVSSNAILYK